MKSYFVINNEKKRYYNIIVYSGLTEVLKKVFIENKENSPFKFIGIGLGKSPTTKYDTSLEFSIGRQEGRFHSFPQSNSFYLDATFPAGIEGNISEMGIFDSKSFGTMLARAILNPSRFKAKNKPFNIIWRCNLDE